MYIVSQLRHWIFDWLVSSVWANYMFLASLLFYFVLSHSIPLHANLNSVLWYHIVTYHSITYSIISYHITSPYIRSYAILSHQANMCVCLSIFLSILTVLNELRAEGLRLPVSPSQMLAVRGELMKASRLWVCACLGPRVQSLGFWALGWQGLVRA